MQKYINKYLFSFNICQEARSTVWFCGQPTTFNIVLPQEWSGVEILVSVRNPDHIVRGEM